MSRSVSRFKETALAPKAMGGERSRAHFRWGSGLCSAIGAPALFIETSKWSVGFDSLLWEFAPLGAVPIFPLPDSRQLLPWLKADPLASHP